MTAAGPELTAELVTLYTTVRPRPVDGVDDGRRQELTAAGATYDAAYEALAGQIPEGWQMLGISRWPTNSPRYPEAAEAPPAAENRAESGPE